MRISDWSSDVCSSDLYMRQYLATVAAVDEGVGRVLDYLEANGLSKNTVVVYTSDQGFYLGEHGWFDKRFIYEESLRTPFLIQYPGHIRPGTRVARSEEHTSELQSLMRISYPVFCLKKNNNTKTKN